MAANYKKDVQKQERKELHNLERLIIKAKKT